MIIDSFSPATSEIIGKVESTPPNQLPKIVSDARKELSDWQKISFKGRARLLRDFADTLVARKQTVADLISRENGKPVVEAYTSEIIPTLDIIKYYSRKTPRMLHNQRVRIGIPLMKTKKAFICYEPLGIVGIISPWNYPLLLPLGQIIPALLAGNAVVFKPSEFTPLVGEMIAQLLWEVGIPRKVFGIVQGGGEVGAAVVTSGVDKIFFTGSTSTGKKVAELAAKNLTPVSLELGSKDAMIVLDDADLETATSGAIWGAFMNAGQTCVSVERCFVHENIFDSFLEHLEEKIKALHVGTGTDTEVDIGAIIHKAQFDVIKLHINDAIQRGARIVAGGSFSEKDGAHFIPPTALVNVPMEALLMNEETFGPVLPIVKFHTDDEAVKLANTSKFGLSASVWTANKKRGLVMAKRLQAGAAVVNDVIGYYGISDGVVGGVKESGTGRVHGKEGLREMVYPKYYEIERAPRMRKLWWYGYDKNLLLFFEAATDFLFSKNIFNRIKSLFKLASKFLRIKKL